MALATTPGRMRLGEILVSDGLVTRAGLECALAAQQRSGELLGRVLLDLGLVGRADLLAAIAKQQGIHHDSLPIVSSESNLRDAPTVPAPPQLRPLLLPRRAELVRRALGVPRRLLLLPVAMLILGAVLGFLIFSMR